MYIWRTSDLSEDIKNDTLSDNEWKNYYLAGSILLTIAMYISMLTPTSDMLVVLFEAIVIVGVIIFGVSITFNTNQAGNGTGMNYIARVTALSLPILVRLFVLSLVLGIFLGFCSEILSFPMSMQNWLMMALTVLIEVLFFWRLNLHLQYINS